jgi:uncharacterized protein (TIGR04255 family)
MFVWIEFNKFVFGMDLPKKITPCPIIDALVEVRFATKIHRDAVFGLIYNKIQTDFPKVESLPILQLPEAVRANDINLKFKPYFRVSNENYVVQIGPDVISISSFPEYAGWTSLSKNIFDLLNKVQEINIINKVSRLGIRYINFFDNIDIFHKINLDININNKSISNRNTLIKTEVENETCVSTLQIANNVINNNKTGSIIDIDTFVIGENIDLFEHKEEMISNNHLSEKKLFFSLLKSDFLKTLNPEY